jgi:protein-S-isoprenylcysteine O-methyltransferase Ste14
LFRSVAIFFVILAFYLTDVWLMRRYDPLRAAGSSRSWSYTAVAVLGAILLIIQPAIWPGLGLELAGLWAVVFMAAGLLLAAGALAIHVWARTHLGQFYGEREEVQPGQFLIERGPYAYVRHPLYTSYFFFTFGFLLINPSLPTVLALVYALVDFSLATRREETLLSRELPGYAEYMARTPRFFPALRRAPKGELS